MSNKIQINILYASEDDKSILDGKGWVTYFKKFLYMMLHQTSGKSFELNLLSDTDTHELKQEGILIALLSPDFILSGNSLDRLESFISNSDRNLEKMVFKVFKAPLDYVDVPDSIKHLPAYKLYHTEEDENQRELHDFFSKEAEKNYWMKMIDLCFDIYEAILEKVKKPIAEKDTSHKRKAVYLAETGQDLVGARNIIKRELIRHGFEVYPKSHATLTMGEWKASIAKDLEVCTFSIHMIGASYGNIPKGSEISIVDLQNEMAASKSEENNKLERLIWISPSLKYASEKQKSFIHNIKRDAHASAGAEVLQTSLEDFKNTLWEQLLAGGINSKLKSIDITNLPNQLSVYLLTDSQDKGVSKTLVDLLKKRNVNVLQMPDLGGLMELRNHHIDCLKQMDAAFVIQDKVNEQWVHMKLLDLLKAPGFGRNKPILGKLLLSSQPKDELAALGEKYQINVADINDIKTVEKFLDQLEKQFEKPEVIN
jgi:hypothetical protein